MTDRQEFVQPDSSKLHPADSQHIKLTYITHYYLNQKSKQSVIELLKKYEDYDDELLGQIQFIIVDDCSPLQFEIPDINLNITWLRITTDIPWNQGGARNLGVTYAKSDKILITDLDFVYPEHTLNELVRRPNPGKKFFKIRIKNPDGLVGKAHSNNFFMSRSRFMRLYGYDEEYSGGYGAEDYRFVKFHKYHGSWQRNLSKKYYCQRRSEIDREKAYHSLERDFSRNTPIDKRKRSELIYWGPEAGHSRVFLNFDWVTVYRNKRDVQNYPRKPQRVWKQLWLFRTLFGTYD